MGSHKGFIANLSATYSKDIHKFFYNQGPPIIVAVSPQVKFNDDIYSQEFFGIADIQSQRSGLPKYNASGGLESYGLTVAAISPITDTISTTAIIGYHRIAGSAADSPLIKQRGSADQAKFGIFVSYSI